MSDSGNLSIKQVFVLLVIAALLMSVKDYIDCGGDWQCFGPKLWG